MAATHKFLSHVEHVEFADICERIPLVDGFQPPFMRIVVALTDARDHLRDEK